MSKFLEDIDAETVWQNLLFWLQSVIQAINAKSSDAFLDLALRCIYKMLKISLEFDDLSREISLNIIHPLLNSLLQGTGTKSQCLAGKIAIFRQCILCYPGPTGRFRTQIENLCLGLLSQEDQAGRIEACKCAAVLPRCGASGERGAKFAEFWSKHFKMIRDTLTFLFGQLFHEKVNQKETEEQSRIKLVRFPEISLTEPEYSTITTARIKSLLLIMEEMFSHQFPSTIQVDINSVFSLCSRVFDKDLAYNSTSIEAVCLSVALPQIWHSMLSLFSVLIAQMGSLLLPFENTVLQIAYQMLTLHQNGGANVHQNTQLKKQVYNMVHNWNVLVGATSSDILRKIVDVVLTDIKPKFQKERTSAPTKDGKRKKMRNVSKLQEVIIEEEAALKRIDGMENSEIACAALTLLGSLIDSTGPIMAAELISKVEANIIAICNAVIDESRQNDKTVPAPYGDEACRKLLLKCAFRLMSLYHHQVPTQMSAFISILQGFTTDPAPVVATDCKVYLNLIDKMIRPSVPALREYQMDTAPSVTNANDEETTAVLSTGLFDELSVMSHRKNMAGLGLNLEQHSRPSKDVGLVSSFGEASFSKVSQKMREDGGQSNGELPGNEQHNDLALTDNEKPIETQDDSSIAKRKSESLETVYSNDERKIKAMGTDDTDIEMNEVLTKRPKLEEIAKVESKNSGDDDVVRRSSTSIKADNELKGNSTKKGEDMTELSKTTREHDAGNNSDVESDTFLKSFVNSMPDSE